MSLPKIGDIAQGVVVRVYPKYAILLFDGGWTGLLHISEISHSFVRNFTAFVSIGNIYNVKVIDVNEDASNVRVSLKRMTGEERKRSFSHQRIDPTQIDFSELEKRLPKWVKEESEGEKKMIKVDETKLLSEIDWKSYEEKVKEIDASITDRTGSGNDFLGWAKYPETYDKEEFGRIKKAAEYIRENFDTLVVCGIGGSYLGARAAIEAIQGLYPERKVEIIYFGQTFSPNYVHQVLKRLETRNFAINVISKSGTTTETAIAFRLVKELLERKVGKEKAAKSIFATTDKEKGALLELCKKEGYERFVLPGDIGGRYSVYTAVGLLPMAVAGIDVDAFLLGAKDAMSEQSGPRLTEAYKYAVIRHEMYKKGYAAEMLVTYEPQLVQLGEWWKQLYGESEGKGKTGLLPDSATFSTDLHSLGQFIQDGKPVLFETIVNIVKPTYDVEVPHDDANLDGLNYLDGKTLDFVNKKAQEGTLAAHVETGKVPNAIINVEKLDAYGLGYLMYFFMRACAMACYLNGVNPFNQPGVEVYKKNMFHLLGKPGY